MAVSQEIPVKMDTAASQSARSSRVAPTRPRRAAGGLRQDAAAEVQCREPAAREQREQEADEARREQRAVERAGRAPHGE
jgi:hypothetical protein